MSGTATIVPAPAGDAHPPPDRRRLSLRHRHSHGHSHHRRRARPSTVVGAMVVAFTLAPLVFLLIDAHHAGWQEVHTVLFRARSAMLLSNTGKLVVIVCATTAVVGTATAWCLERLALPARRLLAALVVLPIAFPDFVVGYTWHSTFPWIHGLMGASLVMTLTSYPLVYLPVRAALRRADPEAEGVARSLGLGPWETFWRVTMRQVLSGLAGGCLLVALAVMAEFGAFEILRFQTFTTEVFTEFQFDPAAASALALPLAMMGLLVLAGEAVVTRRTHPTGPTVSRDPVRVKPSTSAGAGVLVAFGGLVGLAVVLPIATLIGWMVRSQRTTLPASTSLAHALASTVGYGAGGALLATVLAVPVAVMAVRRPHTLQRVMERGAYLVQGLPGVVVALSAVFFTTRYAYRLYQSSTLLIVVYALLFLPLALVCVKVSVVQTSESYAEVSRSLGRGPLASFALITVPLIAPGLAAGFCLVFLSSVTELTATLILIPIGHHTLVTQFWAYQGAAAYGAAAPYALVMILVAGIPTLLLNNWFARRATGATGTTGTTLPVLT